jgi:histidinol-phosphate aminotransferase
MKPLALTSLLRPSIRAIKPYSSAREEFVCGDKEMILLDANENPYPSAVNRYPDPLQGELKKALSAWKKCEPNQLFLSNGSDEVIAHLMTAFCEPGEDHIVLVPPTFGMYAVSANILGVAQKNISLTADFQLDVEAILKVSNAHSKLLFIPTPNNPTGNSFKQDDLLTLLHSFPGLVCIDEAYAEFSKAESFISKLKAFPNLVVMQTFSKAQGMAAIRLGMTFAHQELIAVLNTIKAPYNLNILTQQAALAQLPKQATIESQVATLLDERDRLMEAIATLGFVEKVFPSDANFFLIRVDNSQKRYEELLDHGIVVRHMAKQPMCQNTLRISIGLPEENEALLVALHKMNKK